MLESQETQSDEKRLVAVKLSKRSKGSPKVLAKFDRTSPDALSKEDISDLKLTNIAKIKCGLIQTIFQTRFPIECVPVLKPCFKACQLLAGVLLVLLRHDGVSQPPPEPGRHARMPPVSPNSWMKASNSETQTLSTHPLPTA